jgi:hypothetical protein
MGLRHAFDVLRRPNRPHAPGATRLHSTTHKLLVVLVASLSAGLIGGLSESFARSGAAHGASSSTRSASNPSATGEKRHASARTPSWVWPGPGGFYTLSNGAAKAGFTQALSGDIHYTDTYEPPWDAAHRYWPGISEPKAVVLVTKPYVPGCATQTVTVPLGDGRDQTVNIVRC